MLTYDNLTSLENRCICMLYTSNINNNLDDIYCMKFTILIKSKDNEVTVLQKPTEQHLELDLNQSTQEMWINGELSNTQVDLAIGDEIIIKVLQ